MNIKQAKEYIKDTIRLYLKKDEEGDYRIPVIRQRPIFLLGAPGIGKTAIMEQIAQELGIALVSYSMTHHTRQSALGLPFIAHKEYEGLEYDVSEYTMSEIIAAIYDVMQESGVKEGILFLDEINCVSETLAPSMLQFLQYKVFGRHRVPDGWIIVTAGNPPEYNKSVREFDIVTLDRMKILDVDADYDSFKEYARESRLHAAILNYLEMKREDFYQVETTVEGKRYITARGWEDLSVMLTLYEEDEIPVEEELVGQYLRNPRVVKEFTAYYDLYQKYKNDYQAEDILAGNVSAQAKEKARKAGFDERISLMGMLIDHMQYAVRENVETYEYLTMLLGSMKVIQVQSKGTEENVDEDGKWSSSYIAGENGQTAGKNALDCLREQIALRQERMESLQKAGALSDRKKRRKKRAICFLTDQEKRLVLEGIEDTDEILSCLKKAYDKEVTSYRQSVEDIHGKLNNLFAFVEDVFGSGNEMLILLTECTINQDSAWFISMHGCEAYSRHNEELMISERGDQVMQKIVALDL